MYYTYDGKPYGYDVRRHSILIPRLLVVPVTIAANSGTAISGFSICAPDITTR